MKKRDELKYNGSGIKDPTAYEALANIRNEERESEERLKKLLKKIFRDCEKAGFHLEERVILKDKATGKVWR